MTVAALLLARDSVRAQTVSAMVQAIPVVTRADPTATGSALTEGYLSQPAIMAHASWSWLRATATLNFEGLTLSRGELSTGGYGEGYVDRRHPHSYLHEALVGAVGVRNGFAGSLFAGRGFAPFGSDDPMVRPFEKFPVNHHLAQILERLVAVAAVRRGPVLVEAATFNGDEPTSPSSSSSLRRFGDSWSSRLTLLPLTGLEVSGGYANVKSPEVRTGDGLDQQKSSVVARFSRETGVASRYALLEWAHTNESDKGLRVTSLSSFLGEGAICRAGVIAALRLERTDRPEEERLPDPFRTPRPSVDLANLGVSRWTTATVSLSAPAAKVGVVTGRPFVEIARIGVAAGNPAGIFNPEARYGSNRMWMLSAGVRLRAGSMHDRMGRYGIAAPGMESGTESRKPESDMMPGMTHDMPPGETMSMAHHSMSGQCSL
ncbi:MAG: hypothetical protein JWM41_1202 [Gemmatimonadetes bacterium]|nr:hypothetical protein [Gemmatimonadota bacterium]